LGLGIGANAAIYSFMDAILLRALPVQNPESLMVFNWHAKERPPVIHSSSGSQWRDAKTGLTSGNMPYGFFESLHNANPVFSSVFGFSIDDGDARQGAPLTVTLSYGYAQRRFGDVAQAVAQKLSINGNMFTVSGVTAPEFFGVNPAGAQDLYLPMHTSILLEQIFGIVNPREKYADPHYYWLQMMARLGPGVTRVQAEAAVATLFHHFVEASVNGDRERADLPLLLLKEGAGGLDFLRRQYSQPLLCADDHGRPDLGHRVRQYRQRDVDSSHHVYLTVTRRVA
jgi:hypothetical protein